MLFTVKQKDEKKKSFVFKLQIYIKLSIDEQLNSIALMNNFFADLFIDILEIKVLYFLISNLSDKDNDNIVDIKNNEVIDDEMNKEIKIDQKNDLVKETEKNKESQKDNENKKLKININ